MSSQNKRFQNISGIVRSRSLRRVIQQIINGANPQKIILFGSYASGTPHRDSDVDLLIIMPSRKKPAERAVEISKALRDHPFPMDIMVRTPQEIKERLRLGDVFFQEVVTKGKVLYES